jgi:uncharacterized membrane protein
VGDMTTDHPVPADPAPPSRPRRVTPVQLAWLESELSGWQAAGVVDDVQAGAIRSRYVGARRFSLTKLLLSLGGVFVGVGLLWLVASNLDRLSPLVRFTAVTLLWAGFVVAAEVLANRRTEHRADPGPVGNGPVENGPVGNGPVGNGPVKTGPVGAGAVDVGPVVEVMRLLAALTFGAVVFQAAQSLQVPAYEPTLVGFWGLGVLLYAYATQAMSPLLVGIAATVVWYVWEVFAAAMDGMGFVLPVLLAAVVAAAFGALHVGRLSPAFSLCWREVAALLVLLGLFVAAFPYVDVETFRWSAPVVLGVVASVAAAAGAAALATRPLRWEVLAPVVAAVAGVLLVLWEPPEPVHGVVAAEGYAHAFVSVGVYLVAAGWYAILGVQRDSSRLTTLATAALVLFTTVQSFAVFAPIITGATLFLVLGVVLLGSGYLFDRGRRRLVANLEGVS